MAPRVKRAPRRCSGREDGWSKVGCGRMRPDAVGPSDREHRRRGGLGYRLDGARHDHRRACAAVVDRRLRILFRIRHIARHAHRVVGRRGGRHGVATMQRVGESDRQEGQRAHNSSRAAERRVTVYRCENAFQKPACLAEHEQRYHAAYADTGDRRHGQAGTGGRHALVAFVTGLLFPIIGECENLGPVKRQFSIRHLLAGLAWLALVLAPLTAPAAAMEMTSASIESGAMDMPDGMPCCPDQPAKPDCAKDCPFMAVCAGTVFPVMSGGATLAVPLALLAVIAPRDDAKLTGMAQGPPARPPKA
jgi:hypothetical protein